MVPICAPWIPRCGSRDRAPVRSAAWPWSRRCPPLPPPAPSYTCPMHPEIVRDQPGSCPICGMALEPLTVSVEEEVNPEYVDMRRRFVVSVVLTIPLLVVAMGGHLLHGALARIASPAVWNWVELSLATPVVLWGGWPFFVRGWNSLVNRSLNMFTLISMGVSVRLRLQPGRNPVSGNFPDLISRGGRPGAGVFRGRGDDHHPGPAGAGPGTSGAQPDRSRASAPCWGWLPKRRACCVEDGREADVPLEQVKSGRSAAGPSGRKSAGRWRGPGRRQQRG